MDTPGQDRKRKRTVSPEGVSRNDDALHIFQDADPHQSSAKHRDRASDIANFIRLRRGYEACLRKYDQLKRAYRMEDRITFAETALLVAEPDWCHRRSSSDSVSGHASHSEHPGSNSEQFSPDDEQSENAPSDEENVEDDGSDPVWSLFLKIKPHFKVLVREFAEAFKTACLSRGAKWQDTFEGVRIGDVVMFQHIDSSKSLTLLAMTTFSGLHCLEVVAYSPSPVTQSWMTYSTTKTI